MTGASDLMADDEARLWELVEAALAPLGAAVNQVRHALAARPPSVQVDGLPVLMGARGAFVASLAGCAAGLRVTT